MVTRFWTHAWHKYFHPSNIKIELSYHPFIKGDIFEININLPPRDTPIGIVPQHCEHHNMSYISQSTNNSPWNHTFPVGAPYIWSRLSSTWGKYYWQKIISGWRWSGIWQRCWRFGEEWQGSWVGRGRGRRSPDFSSNPSSSRCFSSVCGITEDRKSVV